MDEATKSRRNSMRRSQKTLTIKMDEIEIPTASGGMRMKAAIIDFITIFGFIKLLIYREFYELLMFNSLSFIADLSIHVIVIFLLYMVPLKLYGQSLGMKLSRIKILNDKEFTKMSLNKTIRRQSLGVILNLTVGLPQYFSADDSFADKMLETKVVYLE